MNVNIEITTALKGIGVPVSFLICNTNPKPPIYVTFFEVIGIDVAYADDKPITSETNIQVDIWAKFGESITNIKQSIIEAMETKGWLLTRIGSDMYEVDTNILHKPLEFKKYESEVL